MRDRPLALARNDAFWHVLEQGSAWAPVLAMEPDSPYWYVEEQRLDDVALAFADFADLKSSYSAGHSRRVADLAVRVARRMRLQDDERATIRRAALMHDVGLAAVPSFALDKPPDRLTQVEQEQVRLHPYHAERILSRVLALAPVIPLVGAHHERMDGRGYHRGLAGPQIPAGARVIAVADRFDELCHESPGQPALHADEALARMDADVPGGLCPDAFQALALEVRAEGSAGAAGIKRRPRAWPADLTDREVEILRLLARGLSRRRMADQLVLSEHTVRHHLEHIYAKVGVSTRVGATLFAVEHDLLR